MKLERKMRLFRPSSYASVDFQNRILQKYRTGEKEMFPNVPEIISEEAVFETSDALMAEIEQFVSCIQTGDQPLVTGEAARRALATAIQITQLLEPSHQ
jgi:predicted dehydrogenase